MADDKEDKDLRRVQFDILPEQVKRFNQLISFCELRTRKDLFDNAMTLFEWAVEEVRKGKCIASYDREADRVEIVKLQALEKAAWRAKNLTEIKLVDTSTASKS
ncbi:hypothetical protein FJY93_03665 [Candidatus Kaiserbacteria bacterium]|nr:hypothetical protein [Candidatus Kaiserbacteria bacterium]